MDEEPLPEAVWWFAILVLYLPLSLGCAFWLGLRGELSIGASELGGGLLVGALVAAATWGLGVVGLLRGMEQALTELIGPLSLPTVVGLAAFSAVGEELLFRGVLLPWWGFWPTAMVFAVVHVPHTRALWPWPFFAFGMGVLLGWMTLWTGDLGAAIGAHFAINLLNLHRLVGPSPQPLAR